MMTKNYEVSKTGFTVHDNETHHLLKVVYEDEIYNGNVLMPEQDERLTLAPWKKGENPFKDEHCFEGVQSGWSDKGKWWFAIRPSSPFGKILAEVESLNAGFGFFKKSEPPAGVKLADVVKKTTKTGFMFWEINDDLGKSCDDIMKCSTQVVMAYGYARRTAVAALFLQGLVSKDVYDHVQGIFKSLQSQTDPSVAFQERAADDSERFMQTYHHLITGLLVKKLIWIAQNCEPAGNRMSDADLFASVIDMVYSDEQARRR